MLPPFAPGSGVNYTAMNPYPLKLERFLSPRLWGGERLPSFLGVQPPQTGDPLGESWQVYAENRVLNGSLHGKTLAEVARTYGETFLGTASVVRYGDRVPLLAKFIDAGDKLSLQVHPDDAYAKMHESASGHFGKTEAWYILHAEPNAKVIWGFKDSLTPEEVREAVEEGRLEPHLNPVPVTAGDVIYNPAGTVHAIGAGVFLFEIQQSSDLTYRLYDYGRRDSEGNLRELHLDKALEVADLTQGERAKVASRSLSEGKTELLREEHFVLERLEVAGEVSSTTTPESFEILTLTDGRLELETPGEITPLAMSLKWGESVVLPAALGAYTLIGEATVLRASIPGE